VGWTDEHLNRFVIQGREYGVAHVGGMSFGATRDECGWPISASGPTSAISTNTISPPAGSTTSGWSACCHWSRDGPTRAAWAADAAVGGVGCVFRRNGWPTAREIRT
jgi:hypothetical protein